MATTITVSYSELDAYRQCPLKWALGYRDLWSKETTEGSALSRGSMWHVVMEAHYLVLKAAQIGLTPEKWRNLNTARTDEILLAAAESVSKILVDQTNGAMSEQAELIWWMYQGHVAQYGIDRDWAILGVEQAGSTRLLTERGYPSRFVLKFKIDLIIRDTLTGQLKIVDHKSAADFSRQAEIDIDDQFGLYDWALAQRGHKALCIIRSDARTRRNKGPMRLEDRFRRLQTFRSDKELTNIALDAYRTAKTAYSRDALVHSSPAPDRCSWRCDFLEPHLAMRKGMASVDTIMLDFGFYQREMKHREYTKAEGQD